MQHNVFFPIALQFVFSKFMVHSYLYGLVLNSPGSTDIPLTLNNSLNASVFKVIRCHGEDLCPKDMFCDEHYGYCEHFRQNGENCRDDEHCEKQLICMFGKCRKAAKPGHKGSRCQSNTDCRRNFCCARNHGEKVCQPLIPKGNRCFVPDGGLEYSINELCPCEAGLVCGKIRNKRKKPILLDWGFKSAFEDIQCVNAN